LTYVEHRQTDNRQRRRDQKHRQKQAKTFNNQIYTVGCYILACKSVTVRDRLASKNITGLHSRSLVSHLASNSLFLNLFYCVNLQCRYLNIGGIIPHLMIGGTIPPVPPKFPPMTSNHAIMSLSHYLIMYWSAHVDIECRHVRGRPSNYQTYHVPTVN